MKLMFCDGLLTPGEIPGTVKHDPSQSCDGVYSFS